MEPRQPATVQNTLQPPQAQQQAQQQIQQHAQQQVAQAPTPLLQLIHDHPRVQQGIIPASRMRPPPLETLRKGDTRQMATKHFIFYLSQFAQSVAQGLAAGDPRLLPRLRVFREYLPYLQLSMLLTDTKPRLKKKLVDVMILRGIWTNEESEFEFRSDPALFEEAEIKCENCENTLANRECCFNRCRNCCRTQALPCHAHREKTVGVDQYRQAVFLAISRGRGTVLAGLDGVRPLEGQEAQEALEAVRAGKEITGLVPLRGYGFIPASGNFHAQGNPGFLPPSMGAPVAPQRPGTVSRTTSSSSSYTHASSAMNNNGVVGSTFGSVGSIVGPGSSSGGVVVVSGAAGAGGVGVGGSGIGRNHFQQQQQPQQQQLGSWSAARPQTTLGGAMISSVPSPAPIAPSVITEGQSLENLTPEQMRLLELDEQERKQTRVRFEAQQREHDLLLLQRRLSYKRFSVDDVALDIEHQKLQRVHLAQLPDMTVDPNRIARRTGQFSGMYSVRNRPRIPPTRRRVQLIPCPRCRSPIDAAGACFWTHLSSCAPREMISLLYTQPLNSGKLTAVDSFVDETIGARGGGGFGPAAQALASARDPAEQRLRLALECFGDIFVGPEIEKEQDAAAAAASIPSLEKIVESLADLQRRIELTSSVPDAAKILWSLPGGSAAAAAATATSSSAAIEYLEKVKTQLESEVLDAQTEHEALLKRLREEGETFEHELREAKRRRPGASMRGLKAASGVPNLVPSNMKYARLD